MSTDAANIEALSTLERQVWGEGMEHLVIKETGARQVRVAGAHGLRVRFVYGEEGTGPLAQRTEAFEREQLLAELKRHARMVDTAKALGMERSHLYKKCQALGIDLRALRSSG